MFVFLKELKVLRNECGFDFYVPQDLLRGCRPGTNPAERETGPKFKFNNEPID
jgi:hypothetical protein